MAEHMPSSHRRYANWTPERIRSRAAANGPHTGILIDVILRAKPHPEQGFRSCIGILRLAKTHGDERLEAACEQALEIGATSYSYLASILKNNLERRAPRQDLEDWCRDCHEGAGGSDNALLRSEIET